MLDKKIIQAAIVSMCVTAIGAAAKSYIDVERLKIRYDHLFDLMIEQRKDIKEIKHYLFEKRK